MSSSKHWTAVCLKRNPFQLGSFENHLLWLPKNVLELESKSLTLLGQTRTYNLIHVFSSFSSWAFWPLMTFQVNSQGCFVPENPSRTLAALDFFRFCVLHHLVDVKCLGWFEIFSTGEAGERFCACVDLSVLLQLLHLWKSLITWLAQETPLIFSVGQQVSFQFMIAWESQMAPIANPIFCNFGFFNWHRRIFFYFRFLSFELWDIVFFWSIPYGNDWCMGCVLFQVTFPTFFFFLKNFQRWFCEKITALRHWWQSCRKWKSSASSVPLANAGCGHLEIPLVKIFGSERPTLGKKQEVCAHRHLLLLLELVGAAGLPQLKLVWLDGQRMLQHFLPAFLLCAKMTLCISRLFQSATQTVLWVSYVWVKL